MNRQQNDITSEIIIPGSTSSINPIIVAIKTRIENPNKGKKSFI
jgi:hypothetical protein